MDMKGDINIILTMLVSLSGVSFQFPGPPRYSTSDH